jgi:hypothetical protein
MVMIAANATPITKLGEGLRSRPGFFVISNLPVVFILAGFEAN